MNITNINKILLIVTIIAILSAGVLLYWQIFPRDNNYYAVMTLGGDMFFGKLHTFRGDYLTSVWTLQRNPQDSANPLSLVKFDQSAFGLEDKIELNQKNIVWKAKLKADSQVLMQIKNSPGLIQPQPQQSPLKSNIK